MQIFGTEGIFWIHKILFKVFFHMQNPKQVATYLFPVPEVKMYFIFGIYTPKNACTLKYNKKKLWVHKVKFCQS